MASRDLSLAVRVTADARQGIDAFVQLKKGVADTQKAFQAAQEKVATLARELKATDAPTKELQRSFEAAKREAASLKGAVTEKREALEMSRRSLAASGVDVKNLASEYRRLGQEAKASAAQQVAAAASAERAARQGKVGAAIDGRALDALGVGGSADIKAEISKVQQAIRGVGGTGRNALDPFTESVARATRGADSLVTQLRPLSAALASVTAGIGVREVIQLADTYAQMTARLQLATKETGDFNLVLGLLEKSATATRAPLTETVGLYTRMAPALNALGLTGKSAVSVVTTVNQAIGLSGVSAQAAEASLTQFGQALASGALRGDELASVLEQTPALASAIAEGLGVTIGELRELGTQGVLTSEKVVKALQRVAGRVQDDFETLPITVGQSITLLGNAFLKFVGEIDKSVGATSLLSGGIAALAANLDVVAQVTIPLVAAATVPLIARLGLATVAATRAAIALAALNPLMAAAGVAAAAAAYFALRNVLNDVAESADGADTQELARGHEKLASQRLNTEKGLAEDRLKLEREVAEASARLDKLRQTAASNATKEEIKGAERLGDALRSAWKESTQAAREARREAVEFFRQADEAAGKREAEADRIGASAEERSGGLSSFSNAKSPRSLIQEADYLSQVAGVAAMDGRADAVRKNAEDALRLAQEAAGYVRDMGDDPSAARFLRQIGEVEKRALEAQGKVREREASTQEAAASAIDQQLSSVEQRITSLKAELDEPVPVEVEIAEAEKNLDALKAMLDGLQDKTITVTVNSVGGGNLLSGENAIKPEGSFASGGMVRGPGTGTSDSILARLSNGEFVMRSAAVRYYGADLLSRINALQLPRFAAGGLVQSGIMPSSVDEPGAQRVPSTLVVPGVGQWQIETRRDVERDMINLFRRAALQRGRRK